MNVEALRRWWSEGSARRDLPWRRTREPWAILVAEVMLQQTQVSRVIPRWHRFLDRFPTPSACASEPAGAVIEEWSGLGYNRRALALHRCAQAVTRDHGGRIPDDLDALLALAGIGPYTARAVLVFAFERDHGVLDTNVARILARRASRQLGRAEAQSQADAIVPLGEAWWWNQALLDLGAQVCRARDPRCGACPALRGCGWQGGDDGADDPAVGSAGVSAGQSRFVGSDRQGRGRLIDALRNSPVAVVDVAGIMGWPDDEARAERVVAGLVADGLAVERSDELRLP